MQLKHFGEVDLLINIAFKDTQISFEELEELQGQIVFVSISPKESYAYSVCGKLYRSFVQTRRINQKNLID